MLCAASFHIVPAYLVSAVLLRALSVIQSSLALDGRNVLREDISVQADDPMRDSRVRKVVVEIAKKFRRKLKLKSPGVVLRTDRAR